MSPARVTPPPVVLTAYRLAESTADAVPGARSRPLRVGNDPHAQAPAVRGTTKAPDALAMQIHQLAVALATRPCGAPGAAGEPNDFAAALARMPADWHLNLTSDTIDQLLRAIKPLPKTGRAGVQRAALYDLTRAARAERMLQAQITRHARQQAVNNVPGALRETGGGGSLGLGVGLPAAVDVGAHVGAARTVSTATFDDLAVATFDTVTVSGEAAAEAGLPGAVGAHAGVGSQVTWGRGRIDDKMPDHVLTLARASVARRLGGPVLLRGLKWLFSPGRDRYAERISRAQAWQSRLPLVLESRANTIAPAFQAAPPAVIEARLRTVARPASATAAFGPAGVGLRAAREKTKVHIDLPLRLTGLGEDAMRARARPHIRQALHDRLRSVVDRPALRASAREQIRALWQDRARACRLKDHRDAVARIAAEFDHLEALARLRVDAPHLAAGPLASLSRDWCGDPASIEAVMVRMLDALAWLQSTPRPTSLPSQRDDWMALQTDVDALANRIHDSTFPHDRREVHRGTHAFADMIQRIRTWRATLEGTAEWTGLAAAARASVARQRRDDADPLRDGIYVDVTFATDLTPSVGPILAAAQRALGASVDALPVAQVEQTLETLAASFQSTAHVQCVLRFFRPRFQDDADFPAAARGTHLQAIRLQAGGTFGMDRRIPIPTPVPGVMVKVGVHAHRTEWVPKHERFGVATLTGALLRYNSLRTGDTDPPATWAQMVALHGPDLDRLAKALAVPDAVPTCEARHWLKRHPDAARSPGRQGPVERLEALANPTLDQGQRRAALHALFMALAEATQQAKRASPLIGPPVLLPSPLD